MAAKSPLKTEDPSETVPFMKWVGPPTEILFTKVFFLVLREIMHTDAKIDGKSSY